MQPGRYQFSGAVDSRYRDAVAASVIQLHCVGDSVPVGFEFTNRRGAFREGDLVLLHCKTSSCSPIQWPTPRELERNVSTAPH